MEPNFSNYSDWRWEFRYFNDHPTHPGQKPWKNRRHLPPKGVKGGWRANRTPFMLYRHRRNRRHYYWEV